MNRTSRAQHAIILCILFFVVPLCCDAFQQLALPRIIHHNKQVPSRVVAMGATPSVVEDPDGPTPLPEQFEVEEIDADEVEGIKEITNRDDFPRPIPHQKWRRGDTAGCEAPICAEWRIKTEDAIYPAVQLAGGKVVDITWYLTTLLITIDYTVLPERDFLKTEGPVIDVRDPQLPMYHVPDKPNPEPIWDDEEDYLYVGQTDEEREEAEELRRGRYAKIDPEEDDPNEPLNPEEGMDRERLYVAKETRSEHASWIAEQERKRLEENEQPAAETILQVNTSAISTIAKAVLDALEEFEEELHIMARHQVVLASTNPRPDVIETQKQFNAHRNSHVIVETIDPFESNRTLKGQLVDRNSMDLYLNIKGRLVTVPLNFVKCVLLPPGRYEVEEEDDEEDDEGVVERTVMLNP